MGTRAGPGRKRWGSAAALALGAAGAVAGALLLLLAARPAFLQADAPSTAALPAPTIATVNRVIDGSSLDAHVDGQRTALGYLGVETDSPREPCGQEALERNRELAGRRVQVQEDPTITFDALGRRLYYVSTLDGESIEETLVREGLARAVRPEGHRGAVLAEAQAEAQAAGTGCLWRP
ncbi:MAG TPA: thermonuclease family protein [Chloroflexota bacterium]|nr:thermonuclease family protein [Chloroflexota bacterium]